MPRLRDGRVRPLRRIRMGVDGILKLSEARSLQRGRQQAIHARRQARSWRPSGLQGNRMVVQQAHDRRGRAVLTAHGFESPAIVLASPCSPGARALAATVGAASG